MPSAMLYTAVVGAVPPDIFDSASRSAIQATGFIPGPWTAAQVVVPVEAAPLYGLPSTSASAVLSDAQVNASQRIGNDPLNAAQRAALAASVGFVANGTGLYAASGPFAGVLIQPNFYNPAPAPSPAPASVTISAFKRVIQGAGGVPASWSGRIAQQVGTALHAFTAASAAWGSTPFGDRGVPANPVFTEAGGTSSNFSILFGLLAVAGLALAARERTSRATPAALRGLGVSRNREHLTFPEWARAAGMSPKKTKPGAHSAWVRGEDPTEWRAGAYAMTSPGRRVSLNGTPDQHRRKYEEYKAEAKKYRALGPTWAHHADMLDARAAAEAVWFPGSYR